MKKIIPVVFCGMALAAVVLMPGIALAEEGSEPSSNQAAAAENQRQTADQQSKEKDDNTVVGTAAAPTQKSEVPVTEVEVKDKKDQKTTAKEGSMAVGYKVENTATTGPWGNMKLQDIPYSINVIPQELIENVQASAPDQLFRMNPVTQLYMPQALNGRPTFNMRGFYSATSAEDGMSNYNGWGIYLEDVDRVEILTGLSGFLYGPGNVGGLVNYIPKRPTAEQIANVTIGNYGGGSNYLHGDFGGPVGKDSKLAYRLNVLAQDGDTAIENQSLNRKMVSGALDWHIASNLLVQFNASHQDYKANGSPTSWGTASGVAYPSAPDAEKLWSQKWTFQKLEADRAGINLKWDISDVFTLRTAYRSAEYNDQTGSLAGTIQNNGTYTEGFSVRAPRTLQTTGSQAFLDAHFNTGLIEHKVTMGFYGNTAKWKLHQDSQYSINLSGSFSFADPVYVTMPSYAAIGTKPWYTSYDGANKNYMFGDDIKFNDSWSALVGLNHGTIIAKNYNTAGVQTSKYDMSATTPSLSLVYKPAPAVMTYATYMESLEQGQIVTGTQYTNNGAILPPFMSKQYEVGAKTTVGGTLFTVACFQIDKALQYSVNNNNGTYTYVQDGRQVHKGIEFTATGKVAKNLTLVGGLTLLDAQVAKNDSTPALVGKQPANVAEQMIKLYAEYDVNSVPGLTLIGGVYRTGSFYADAMNTQKLSGATITDIGARYQTKIAGTPVTYRLYISNLFNKNYWMSGSFVGDPRTIALSAQMKL